MFQKEKKERKKRKKEIGNLIKWMTISVMQIIYSSK